MTVQEIFLNAITDSGEWKNGISTIDVLHLQSEFKKLEDEIDELRKFKKKHGVKKVIKRAHKKKVTLKKDIKIVGMYDKLKNRFGL